MHSHLVTVHNQEENVHLQHQHNGEGSWIGLNYRSVEGSFVWAKKGISGLDSGRQTNQKITQIRTVYTLLVQTMDTLEVSFHVMTVSNSLVLKVKN